MRQLLASRFRAFGRIAAAMAIALYPAWTFAADWPQRPVTVVVPFAAGGNTDTVARILCQRMTEKLGQPFVIDNRGGASGAIAAANVASAAPDGYTLLLGSTPQIAIVPFIQKVSYDPRKDLVPTSIFAIGTFVLAVSAAVPADTMADFIAYAKARPQARLRLGRQCHHLPAGRRAVRGACRLATRARPLPGRRTGSDGLPSQSL
jgi:tripartite-type tricarboxylate transporter receptor subunit TctC